MCSEAVSVPARSESSQMKFVTTGLDIKVPAGGEQSSQSNVIHAEGAATFISVEITVNY